MLQNMRIRNRLFLGFGMVLLLFVAVTGVAVHELGALFNATEDLYDHPLTVSRALREMHVYFIKISRTMHMVILDDSETAIDKSEELIKAYEAEVEQRFAILRERFLGDQEKINALYANFLAWRPLRDQVIVLARQQKDSEAFALFEGREAQYEADLERDMQFVIDFAKNKATEFMAEARARRDMASAWVVGLLAAAVVLSTAIVVRTTGAIVRPLEIAISAADRLAKGDVSIDLPPSGGNETGRLLTSMKNMLHNFIRLADTAQEIAGGNTTVEVMPLSDHDLLGLAMRNMVLSLRRTAEAASAIASGDLTIRITPSSEKDLFGKALADMVQNLRAQIRDIVDGANSLASSSGEIAVTTSQLSANAAEVSASVTQTVTSMKEVRQTAELSNDKSKLVSENSRNVVQVSKSGEQSVNETIATMASIQEQMQTIAEGIIALSEKGLSIGDIIIAVDDIAEQSRLLAVNASIEAVKAGEYGKGFGVVAAEIKNLAEQSKQSTAQVRTILTDIQRATSTAVMATEKGSKAVEAGVRQATRTGASIQALAQKITEAAQAASQIEATSNQQLVGIDQVFSAMGSINTAMGQAAEGAKQLESASRGLEQFGRKLKQMVEKYRV